MRNQEDCQRFENKTKKHRAIPEIIRYKKGYKICYEKKKKELVDGKTIDCFKNINCM